MKINDKKILKFLLYGLIIFLIGGFGSLIVQKYMAPYLSGKPVFKNFGFLRPDSPIVITKSELVRVNENVRLNDLIKQLSPKMVLILSGRGSLSTNFSPILSASGVIVSADGIIAMDKSIFADKNLNHVAVTSEGDILPLTTLARDPKSDLILVKAERNNLSAVDFGLAKEVAAGQQVVVMRGSQTRDANARVSYVASPQEANFSKVYSSEEFKTPYILDAGADRGSGVFNLKGELVGMGTKEEILGAEALRSGIDSYFKNERIVRPFLGIDYGIFDKTASILAKLEGKEGVVVKKTKRAQLQEGDIIFKINGESLNNGLTLEALLNRGKPGDKWALSIVRKGQEQAVEIVLGEMK